MLPLHCNPVFIKWWLYTVHKRFVGPWGLPVLLHTNWIQILAWTTQMMLTAGMATFSTCTSGAGYGSPKFWTWFVVFYFSNTKATSTRSLGIKMLHIEIFGGIPSLVVYRVELLYHRLLCRPFRPLGGRERSSRFRDIYRFSRCECANLSTSSVQFLLSLSKCTSSN